jgi:hypothetical protein
VRQNHEQICLDWFRSDDRPHHGWVACYRPSLFGGVGIRIVAETRLTRALECVSEDGHRLVPFPRRTSTHDPVVATRVRAEFSRHERDLLGVG